MSVGVPGLGQARHGEMDGGRRGKVEGGRGGVGPAGINSQSACRCRPEGASGQAFRGLLGLKLAWSTSCRELRILLFWDSGGRDSEIVAG